MKETKEERSIRLLQTYGINLKTGEATFPFSLTCSHCQKSQDYRLVLGCDKKISIGAITIFEDDFDT